MYLILTMAGRYSRFTNAGYKLPKYLLPWGNKTILAKILSEMKKDSSFEGIYLIANKKDMDYAPHILATMNALSIHQENLIFIADTSGQAQTAAIGIEKALSKGLPKDAGIVFHNVDTILYGRDYSQISNNLQANDAFIDIFSSHNQQYSYVILNENQLVEDLAEKKVVSELATSGMYGFKSANQFFQYYDSQSDIYITDIYKKMLLEGLKISVSPLHSEKDTVVLGTPEEYIQKSVTVDSSYF